MLPLNKSFWSLDQNGLFKVSIMEQLFSERNWMEFGHGPLCVILRWLQTLMKIWGPTEKLIRVITVLNLRNGGHYYLFTWNSQDLLCWKQSPILHQIWKFGPNIPKSTIHSTFHFRPMGCLLFFFSPTFAIYWWLWYFLKGFKYYLEFWRTFGNVHV